MTYDAGRGYDPDEPILRGEYEERHAALGNRYETFARVSRRILGAIVCVVIVNALVSTILLGENRNQTNDIEGSLVENCAKSGNPTRAAVRIFGYALIDQAKDNIKQSLAFQRTGTYEEIFSGYPPGRLNKLLAESREEEWEKIRRLRKGTKKVVRVDCEKKFSK